MADLFIAYGPNGRAKATAIERAVERLDLKNIPGKTPLDSMSTDEGEVTVERVYHAANR